jgi:2-oxoisovalerate dehydrogenase E1 component
MYNEKVQVPLVVRTPMGAYRSYGPTHSQSLEKHFLGVPGLWVISPNVFVHPGEMLRQAVLQLQEPVLFVEHKYAYAQPLLNAPEGMAMEVIEGEQGHFPAVLLRHQKSDPAMSGLIFCYGGLSKMCLDAVVSLRDEEGITMDLAVISQLSPSPIAQLQILFDQYKDSLLAYVEEASLPVGWGSEMMAVMQEFAMKAGECPLRQMRIGSEYSVIPSSKQLEAQTLPNVRKIIDQVVACF